MILILVYSLNTDKKEISLRNQCVNVLVVKSVQSGIIILVYLWIKLKNMLKTSVIPLLLICHILMLSSNLVRKVIVHLSYQLALLTLHLSVNLHKRQEILFLPRNILSVWAWKQFILFLMSTVQFPKFGVVVMMFANF